MAMLDVQNRVRFDEIDREQLAAQLVAVMDAHFQRPNAEDKRHILQIAERQISGEQFTQEVSNGFETVVLPANNDVIVG
jgi:alpha-D-ribose 1-methylphosphonate 5-triphosphate synthase subunit PhnG